eukprot:15188-Heterococcus_DN1.PRE.3
MSGLIVCMFYYYYCELLIDLLLHYGGTHGHDIVLMCTVLAYAPSCIAQAEATVRSSKGSAHPASTATAILLTLSSIDGLIRCQQHQQQQQAQHTTAAFSAAAAANAAATATATTASAATAMLQAHNTAVVKTFRGLVLTARTASSSRGSSAQARAHSSTAGSSSSQHCSKVMLSVQQLQQYIVACHSNSTGASPAATVDSTTAPTPAATGKSTPHSCAATNNTAHVQPQQHTIPTSPIIQVSRSSNLISTTSSRSQVVNSSSTKSAAAAAVAAVVAAAVPQTEDSESDDSVQEDDSDSENSDCSD